MDQAPRIECLKFLLWLTKEQDVFLFLLCLPLLLRVVSKALASLAFIFSLKQTNLFNADDLDSHIPSVLNMLLPLFFALWAYHTSLSLYVISEEELALTR